MNLTLYICITNLVLIYIYEDILFKTYNTHVIISKNTKTINKAFIVFIDFGNNQTYPTQYQLFSVI